MIGLVLSFAAGRLIETLWPLLTVLVTWHWIVIAAIVATAGATISAAYPAWRAARVDMVEALAWE